ncbi:universal stress protein [Roseivirga sp. BDSF3-8]|uniref:universal stress protein n=1 Tax=Roseivirga sp. BDSF3-8 TaxID=3241598 RepID=UPI003531C5BF
MYAYKRLLVALDLTAMDDTLVRYTAFLAKNINADAIYFLHVSPSLELPDDIGAEYRDVIAPVDETLEHSIKDMLDRYFDYDCTIEVEAQEGNPGENILKWIKVKNIDLVIVGRKQEMKGTGALGSRLSRIAPCSILFVPENFEAKLEDITVSSDYSKHSAIALEEAYDLAKSSSAKLHLVHVTHVPPGYHKTGKSYEEFGKIMVENARKDADKFLKKYLPDYQDKVNVLIKLDDDKSPADKLYDASKELNADLMIVGSKGRTALASLLLGSVADKLAGYTRTLPLLVVKDKKENLSFFEALLKL